MKFFHGEYNPFFKAFKEKFSDKDIDKLSIQEIHDYIITTIKDKQLSETQQKHLLNAIKFYYEKVEGRDKIYIPLNNKPTIFKTIVKLNYHELENEISGVKNTEARLLLYLKYGLGFDETQIAGVTLEKIKEIIRSNYFEGQTEFKQSLLTILKIWYEKNSTVKYLFEKCAGKPFEEDEIKEKIEQILPKYKLAGLYKSEMESALKQAGFKNKTIKIYTSYYMQFLEMHDFRHPNNISDEEIRRFLHYQRKKNEGQTSKQNQFINAIKFFYHHISGRQIPSQYIYRPKPGKRLPEVLSMEEISRLLDNIENLKHRCIVELTYSTGARCSEILNLKKEDIDYSRNNVIIRGGKGDKDRITLLSDDLKHTLDEYYLEYKPREYVIEGATGGKYSASSLRMILSRAKEKAGIKKRVTMHILRHSFATHLLEGGTDIRLIQKTLGHTDIKTTARYSHVANMQLQKIINPLDRIRQLNSGQDENIQNNKSP